MIKGVGEKTFNKKNTIINPIKSTETRVKHANRAVIISIIGNIFLFLIKLILGIFINSISLIADSVHSLSDMFTSFIVYIGFKISVKPPDEKHPYGHGRVEYITTLLIAVILIFIGIGLIQQSYNKLSNMQGLINQNYTLPIIIIVLLTALVKEIMAIYSKKISKRIQSEVLEADSWHHRTDSLTSIGVAISIYLSSLGYYYFDSIFGFIISGVIIYVGINLIKSSSNFLIGQKPDEKIIKQIENIVFINEEIENVHNISIHDYGISKIITLHAKLDKNLSLDKAHNVADKIETDIEKQINCITVIHLEPSNISKKDIEKNDIVECLRKFKKDIYSFHKIQIICINNQIHIKIHVTVENTMTVNETHELHEKIKKGITQKIGVCEVDIHFDPLYND
jgi:cation diffusion facilitator family transporter